MITVKEDTKIYVCLNHVDMRKDVNGLSAIVLDEFSESPTSGDIFIFFNRARDKLKCLFWDKNGFVLYYKRMEKRRFIISKLLSGDKIEITGEQLKGLLAGFDFTLMQQFPDLSYSAFY